MEPKLLASIDLKWDEFGNVSHTLDSKIPANEYQRADAIALGVVLLTCTQLGNIPPIYGLQVCDRLMRHLDGLPLNPEPILDPLCGGRIDLVQKGTTIVDLFHPVLHDRGTMQLEEAVARLLGNLPLHLERILSGQLAQFYKNGLLFVVNYYLTQALPRVVPHRGISQQQLQADMIEFNHNLFPLWRRGFGLVEGAYSKNLQTARSSYKKLVGEF